MKYKVRQTGKSQKIIDVHISREIIATELDKIYQEISKTASLPGFRPGKAPMDLIKKRYKKEASDEAVRSIVLDSLGKAVGEEHIDVIGSPQVCDLEYDEEEGMSYKATVSIRPDVRLRMYKGIALKESKKQVEQKDVEAEISGLREMGAKFIAKDGPADDGDYIVCDLGYTIEGRQTQNKENAWLYVGDGSFIPSGELKGMNAGETKEVEKQLPADYSDKELAGKYARFTIKAKEVKKKILPELDDAFASTAGDFRSMAELKEAISQNLKRRYELDKKRDLEAQALKILDENASFDAPEALVDRHFSRLKEETRQRLKGQGYEEKDIKAMEQDFEPRLKEEAAREVRAYFILDKIAALENITVSEKELASALEQLAAASARPLDEVKKAYAEAGRMDDLSEEIRHHKILDFVIKNANII